MCVWMVWVVLPPKALHCCCDHVCVCCVQLGCVAVADYVEYSAAPLPPTPYLCDHHMCVPALQLGYVAVGVAGYVAYPGTVGGNVLNSFPEDDRLMQVARVVIGLVVLGHFPLNHHPARQATEDGLRDILGLYMSPQASVAFTFFLYLAVEVGGAAVGSRGSLDMGGWAVVRRRAWGGGAGVRVCRGKDLHSRREREV